MVDHVRENGCSVNHPPKINNTTNGYRKSMTPVTIPGRHISAAAKKSHITQVTLNNRSNSKRDILWLKLHSDVMNKRVTSLFYGISKTNKRFRLTTRNEGIGE